MKNKIPKDYSGSIFKFISIIKFTGFRYIFTLINRLIFYFKHVDLGNKCVFYGLILINRKPNTKIEIGHNCDLRSIQSTNLIGINRKCSFSTLNTLASISIGNNCGFSGTVIGAFTSITIGNNVKCGANSLITDSNWHLGDPRSGQPKPIVIHDNVWLGVNVVVLKGVSIGKNTVIGANSVVTKSIPPNSVAAGNPCNVIRQLRNDELVGFSNNN